MDEKFQVIQGGRVSPKHVRECVHKQAVVLLDGIQCVARRNGLSYNEVLEMVVEQERILAAKREKAAYVAGRASLWQRAA